MGKKSDIRKARRELGKVGWIPDRRPEEDLGLGVGDPEENLPEDSHEKEDERSQAVGSDADSEGDNE